MTLDFESNAWFQCVAGYVYFHNERSQLLLIAFTVPVAVSTWFAACCGSTVPDDRQVIEYAAVLTPPGGNLLRAEGCCWVEVKPLDGHVTVRCVILPVATAKL